MKRYLFASLLIASPLMAAMDVREVSVDCVAGAVSVSTTTPTLIPAVAFSGRNRIDILNTDNTYDVALGTSAQLSYAQGFLVTNSTDAFTSKHTVLLPSGKTVYGLGEANTVRGTLNVRYLECK